MEQDRVLFAKGAKLLSFINKETRRELRTTTLKGYSGSIHGYHLSYREKTDRWWTTYLCWKIYETDTLDYKNYVEDVLSKLIDKLNTEPI